MPRPRFDDATIAARIGRARDDRGWSRKEMAAKAGIPQWSYYKKEDGTTPFSLHELSRVADALGAPRLFPFLEWDAAALVDRLMGRNSGGGA